MTRCSRCQQMCSPIEVHGHTQCNRCGSVMEECCQGENVVSSTTEVREEKGNDDAV